ncbi:MAG: purine-nucleoside phosphorylase [Candidatus Infernicultor aquiphilus]|uniref:Purine nucleoside phosphorylase n=1 Tax=Candidatus Infernicultor aquiphilus TaxID=1805029 RepID=A0A1J5GNS5_9BACT|nr:purine-nucleoside phosphorylase [bacterium]OIP69510.1 MAG: purine-nucleoside phosphorylase [Candidatus Atribacteria bacterium CG2_30_33_13]PIU25494.1 MAG: purine-nucleoside phosphorylase [Candidatus Atribacteria bacterium CG08_land_8_20_14_0_20_33_29]PIW11720.1 MAG: purine-nucleoside phosphorylase [Candidatus Atribacteria bacterium CG17_big_fil_post_rev_8_21_14_2_50_34_11]PIX34375.1 MAG: purine-nucleoside phosphorylase [Candidatus Atribacteria bacterium CG_4_8_14_3_um_filter_34_18]PIY32351.
MEDLKAKITESVEFINQKSNIKPKIAIILGTGLGRLAEDIQEKEIIPYSDIPNFPISTVQGHGGNLVLGKLENKEVVAMQGRFHYYEGYNLKEVTFPVRVMKKLGAEVIIISNAAGGMNRFFKRGDLMLITDHINLFGDNPLIGPNDEELGLRFPDMSEAYDRKLVELTLKVALKEKIKLHQGIYVGLTGPTLETPAEYRFLIKIGADAVGMSTVPEVIVANHMGMKVLGISCITDLAINGVVVKTGLEEILKAASDAEPIMTKLVKKVIQKIDY